MVFSKQIENLEKIVALLSLKLSVIRPSAYFDYRDGFLESKAVLFEFQLLVYYIKAPI
jgi:hypothetical protein